MICPNCKSNIPDDSKFCPDCGTPVKNEEEIRMEASQIVSSYKKGYDYYVGIDDLPHYSTRLTIANCEKIIAKKKDIRKKQIEIEAKESMAIMQEACSIATAYNRGFDYYVKTGSVKAFSFSLSIEECNKIIAIKDHIKGKHENILLTEEREENMRTEAIRKEAASITLTYAKGYNFYVINGILPRFVHNMKAEDCQKIIDKKNDIIRKQKEVEADEKKLEEEAKIKQEQERKEKERLYVLSEIKRLGITNKTAIDIFLDNPERIKSEYWRKWALEKEKETTKKHTNYSYSSPTNNSNSDGAGCAWAFIIILIIIAICGTCSKMSL